MKATVSTWNYRELFQAGQMDLPAMLDDIHRLGADGAEIFARHIDADDPAGSIARAADKAGALGLDIASLIAGNDFARPTAAERADETERMKAWIGYAADAGIERMNTFTGYHTPGADGIAEMYRVIDAYREAAPVAEQRGVLLCVENHSGVCPDADGLLWIIKQIDSPAVRTNPDFTNFVAEYPRRSERSREAIYTESAKLLPQAANAHLKVSDFTDDGEHAHVDMPRLMTMLREAGYDGHIVLEAVGEGDLIETSAKGLALLRKYL